MARTLNVPHPHHKCLHVLSDNGGCHRGIQIWARHFSVRKETILPEENLHTTRTGGREAIETALTLHSDVDLSGSAPTGCVTSGK